MMTYIAYGVIAVMVGILIYQFIFLKGPNAKRNSAISMFIIAVADAIMAAITFTIGEQSWYIISIVFLALTVISLVSAICYLRAWNQEKKLRRQNKFMIGDEYENTFDNIGQADDMETEGTLEDVSDSISPMSYAMPAYANYDGVIDAYDTNNIGISEDENHTDYDEKEQYEITVDADENIGTSVPIKEELNTEFTEEENKTYQDNFSLDPLNQRKTFTNNRPKKTFFSELNYNDEGKQNDDGENEDIVSPDDTMLSFNEKFVVEEPSFNSQKTQTIDYVDSQEASVSETEFDDVDVLPFEEQDKKENSTYQYNQNIDTGEDLPYYSTHSTLTVDSDIDEIHARVRDAIMSIMGYTTEEEIGYTCDPLSMQNLNGTNNAIEDESMESSYSANTDTSEQNEKTVDDKHPMSISDDDKKVPKTEEKQDADEDFFIDMQQLYESVLLPTSSAIFNSEDNEEPVGMTENDENALSEAEGGTSVGEREKKENEYNDKGSMIDFLLNDYDGNFNLEKLDSFVK